MPAPYLILLIPIISAMFVVAGWGDELTGGRFPFRACVSVSCAVILWLMSAQEIRKTICWVIAALVISSVADWFMMNAAMLVSNVSDKSMMNSGRVLAYFLCGICLFFTAHIGFLVFCLKNGRIAHWLLLPVLTGYLAFFFLVLYPAISNSVLLVAVLAYLLISCISLAAAAGLRLFPIARWNFTVGIALIVFSDTIIALSVFAGYGKLDFLILPTYFACHVMITFALMTVKPSKTARLQ